MHAMTIRLSTLIIGAGLFVAAVGAILGLVPLTHAGDGCGAPFLPSATSDVLLTDVSAHEDACKDLTSARRGIALALLLPGAGLAGAGIAVIGREPATATARA